MKGYVLNAYYTLATIYYFDPKTLARVSTMKIRPHGKRTRQERFEILCATLKTEGFLAPKYEGRAS